MNAVLTNDRAAADTAAPRFASPAEQWEAVRRRDPAADGHFLYAVDTTGVYCRPSCAARPARREHVTFHATPAAAERAGFRPCKRCRPDLPPRAERDAALVAEACRTIEAAEEPPRLADLAAQAGVSPHHFHRTFKRIAGVTPRAYAAAHRQRRVQDGLAAGAGVTDALYAAGFGSAGRFYATAPAMLGMTPSAYRRGGQGEAVWYAVDRCSLGYVLVAATERGVCAIMLGDEPAALTADLAARFPHARLTEPDPGFADWVAAVVRFVDDPARAGGLGLPLDVRGTAFQRRVWEALREIPAGQTASYADVAARLGSPRAVRAVAGACAANPLAVAIPCHRVVARDGGLAGYRWGVERKQRLLERERA
ncbi:MAG TPA: bifunctional DNA-binding transcriptional regulator/O6-methylguanine-DNA methyltransferase Ada [Chloroflexota bacterium]|nr:bifunctional DNA-binding transcriptional regulator/O6-methylguanine-DNA methyltransferase Ada [Chloroflexota bacterium]